MLGRFLAAGLVLGGSALIGIETGTDAQHAVTCAKICSLASTGNGSGQAALDEGVAHIAVRAATPGTDSAPLTKGEWLSLYLLLSLRADGKDTAL